MMPVTSKNKKILNLVCLSILLIILMAGLWPLNLNPPNQVHWIKNEPGVRIDGMGLLYSQGDLFQNFFSQQISLELWLRPAQEPNDRLPYIFSFYDGPRQEVFLLGQWKDSLILRTRTQNPKAIRGYRENGCGNILIEAHDIFLTLTSSSTETKVFSQGRLLKEIPGFSLLEDWIKSPGTIILGNSADGRHFWPGLVLGLGLYNRVLSGEEIVQNYFHWLQRDYRQLISTSGPIALYPFDESQGHWAANFANNESHLFIPGSFSPLRKVVLEWPSKEYMKRLSFYQDLAVNVLGFIPLGFFFALWFFYFTCLNPAGVFSLTFLIGSLISLGIELAQVYLPGRDSSASDLVCNMAGTLIGIALQRWWPFSKNPGNNF
jgi:VanZ family protein